MKVKVFIPSRSRATSPRLKVMLSQIGSTADVSIVVPFNQVNDYESVHTEYEILGVPAKYDGIARTRQWIGKLAQTMDYSTFCMIDDDLKFFKRRKPDDWHLQACDHAQMEEMFRWMYRLLIGHQHAAVGVSTREGNNCYDHVVRFNTRLIRVLAFKTREFNECIHGRVPVMEDFDVLLQLLRRGHSNACLWNFAQDQQQTQWKGGCSDYRTQERHSDAAETLANLHHPFVTLLKKKNKTGGEFGERTEVRIYWKKAYQGKRDLPSGLSSFQGYSS